MENKTLPKAQQIQGLSSFTFVSVSVLVGALTSLVCITLLVSGSLSDLDCAELHSVNRELVFSSVAFQHHIV